MNENARLLLHFCMCINTCIPSALPGLVFTFVCMVKCLHPLISSSIGMIHFTSNQWLHKSQKRKDGSTEEGMHDTEIETISK